MIILFKQKIGFTVSNLYIEIFTIDDHRWSWARKRKKRKAPRRVKRTEGWNGYKLQRANETKVGISCILKSEKDFPMENYNGIQGYD